MHSCYYNTFISTIDIIFVVGGVIMTMKFKVVVFLWIKLLLLTTVVMNLSSSFSDSAQGNIPII